MKVIKFAPGLIPVLKHEEHDQKTHGSWAGVGGMATEGKNLLSGSQIKDIESALSKIPKNHLEALLASGTKVRIMDSPKVMSPEEAPHFHRADNEIRLDKNSGASALLHEIGHALDFNAKSGDGFLSDDPNFRKIIKDSKFPNFATRRVAGVGNRDYYRHEEFAVAYENYYTDGGKFIGASPTKEFKQVMEGIGEYILSERVNKHGTHDQKTHGNWARGGGGNGLGHRAVYQLQVNMPDILKSSVYAAEANHNGHSKWFNPVEKPFPPNNRDEYATSAEYDKAYKEYSKKFDEWAKGEGKRLESDLGKELLDGTKAGVQRYVNKVTDSDWFTEAFGDGGIIGTPKVTLTSSNRVIGQYTVGVKNGVGISGLAIHKYNMQDEVTILHEIAHYATAINETNRYSAHGQEFARNHLYILDHAISPAYADGLEKRYREAGVPLGN